MSIASIGSCAPAQAQVSQASGMPPVSETQGRPPPPPPPADFVNTIASALSELDVSAASSPVKDLSEFLNTLMETLKSQGSDTGLRDLADGGAEATAALEASFSDLLGALGLDSSDAGAKLGQFLQSLADKLEVSGPSGMLINTAA